MRTLALLRVSTGEQDVEVQRLQVERWAAAQDPPRTVEYTDEPDVCSVAKDRPGLDAVVASARSGDEVVVVALDRLGRSLVSVVMLLEDFRSRGVRVVSLREAIDLGTAAGRFQAQVVCAFAELERELIRERTRAGMQSAKRRGTRSGRPVGRPKLLFGEAEASRLRELRASGKSWEQIHDDGFELVQEGGAARRVSAWALRTKFEAWERKCMESSSFSVDTPPEDQIPSGT